MSMSRANGDLNKHMRPAVIRNDKTQFDSRKILTAKMYRIKLWLDVCLQV